MRINKKAYFVTFEGGEGSGKSTHIKHLAGILKKEKINFQIFYEPGSTRLGEKIRNILLHNKGRIYPRTELFLYLAARAQFVEDKLLPALQKKQVVICDRFSDSTLVYQGYGLGLNPNAIKPILQYAAFGIMPDLTFILKVPPKEGLLRIKRKKDRIEKRNMVFHKKLQKGYIQLAKHEPQRVKIINASNEKGTKEEILNILKSKNVFTKPYRA